jgi:hypothetical protein
MNQIASSLFLLKNMRTLTIQTTTFFLLFFVSVMGLYSNNRTEQQAFQLVKDYHEFEIRFYPEAVLATVYSKAESYRAISGTGFNALAGYIFGGNESNEKIAMTAPVHMNIEKGRSSMSFVMPGKYSMEDLPAPDNQAVTLSTSPAEYVAAIRFGGWASDQKIKEYSAMLDQLLRKNNISHKGNFRYLGYNPPYQFTGRRNEIIVTVNWKN